jgi:hypothetical protein
VNLYIPQLQFALQRRWANIDRENRQNGKQESSYKGPREEGRQKGSKEKVAGLSNQKATGEGKREGVSPRLRLGLCFARAKRSLCFERRGKEKGLDLQRSR